MKKRRTKKYEYIQHVYPAYKWNLWALRPLKPPPISCEQTTVPTQHVRRERSPALTHTHSHNKVRIIGRVYTQYYSAACIYVRCCAIKKGARDLQISKTIMAAVHTHTQFPYLCNTKCMHSALYWNDVVHVLYTRTMKAECGQPFLLDRKKKLFINAWPTTSLL